MIQPPRSPLRPRKGGRPLLDRINARRPLRVQWEENPDESGPGELLLGVAVIIIWTVVLFIFLPLLLS